MELDYSYKGYLFNLEDIVNDNRLSSVKSKIKPLSNKNDLFKEEDFSLYTYEEIFKKNKDIKDLTCPKDFIIVPDNLFELLYKQINKNNKFQKNDYKFNILIGDNALFIKDQKSDLIFYVFFFKENYILYYLFQYDKKKIFYEEISEYIKGKGFINYLLQRNIIYSEKKYFENILNSKNNDIIIGKYINFKKIEEDLINKIKIKNKIAENKKILRSNKEFIEKLFKLKESKIKFSNINILKIHFPLIIQ